MWRFVPIFFTFPSRYIFLGRLFRRKNLVCEHTEGNLRADADNIFSLEGGADYAKLIWQQKDLEIMIGSDLQARSIGGR